MKIPRWLRSDGGAPILGAEPRAATMAQSPYDQPTIHINANGELDPERIRQAVREATLEWENPSVVAIREGWGNAKGMGHMCLPPDVYPDGWGPDSMYKCPECGCPWQAKGIRNLSDTYKWYGFGALMIYGPKQWLYAGPPDTRYRDADGHNICSIPVQQGFYDWRDASEPLYDVLNRMATLLHDMHTLMHISAYEKTTGSTANPSGGKHHHQDETGGGQ